MFIVANCSWSFVYSVIILCVSLLPHVYCCTVCVLLYCVCVLLYCVCIVVLCVLLYCVYCCTVCVLLYCVFIAALHTLVAGLLAKSQYPEGPAIGHLSTGYSWFPCV